MVNNSKLVNKEKRKLIIRQIIPDLLLSYVYFLNEWKTSSIIIGYDAESFGPKMFLLKEKQYQTLSWDDWHFFYNYSCTIQQYFNDVDIEKTGQMVNGKCQRFKLSLYKGKKHVIFIENSSKIKLNACEWERLWSLAPLLHSIFSWYMLTEKEISSYYILYLQKCILQNCSKLDYKDFFTPMHQNNNYCNYSRLFNELGILCKNKLINDLYYTLCNNAD